jgi:hypothetical protein
MPRPTKTKISKKGRREETFPLEKKNFAIIGLGIVFIVAGYLALLEKTVEGFLPLVAAPILLVLGYCVIIPIGILYAVRDKRKAETAQTPPSH